MNRACATIILTLATSVSLLWLASISDTGFRREHGVVVKFIRDCHRKLGLVETSQEGLACTGGMHGR